MALDILITTDRISRDPMGRELVDHVRGAAAKLHLRDGALYYDFPTYADYETVAHKPDFLLISPYHGLLAIRMIDGADSSKLSSEYLDPIDDSLSQFCSILIGRLLKSRSLRKGLSRLLYNVTPVIFIKSAGAVQKVPELDSATIVQSQKGFEDLLNDLRGEPLSSDVIAETRSVIEGAKALTRPQKRVIENPSLQKPAAALMQLEAEIANFDQRQRRAALVTVPGPQRIRGLAGSGKTVILAMKAAHLHLTRPDERILVTFFTRSLRASLKNLITKFFRNYKDEDPDWNRIHIRHGWGGATLPGVYSDAARRHGVAPLTFGTARARSGRSDPFDFACRDLLSRTKVEPYYHHILIDEGQDFPSGFYELCFEMAKGSRDQKNIVWAYDELQNILDVKIRSPEQLFGTDQNNEARISLERSGRNLPPDSTNDTVLSKCYRNQREVLVTAHAVGFGVYRDIVQLLESRDHWQDVGYEVVSSGEFKVGQSVKILRPPENSPLSLDTGKSPKVIEWFVSKSVEDEFDWVVSEVRKFIDGGLQPEDILVVALDDRNARTYFREISSRLANLGVSSNNIMADPYTEPPFSIPGKVTLSTVYRAKGNEASVVCAVGVDGVVTSTRSGRNKLFTAFTRTKAWLRVSGYNGAATNVCAEIDAAEKHFPYIEFTMPDLKKVELIQRDLSARNVKAKKIKDEFTRRLRSEGFTDDEIAEILTIEDAK